MYFNKINILGNSYYYLAYWLFDYLDMSDYRDAMKYFDKSINFADCTINTMVNHKITKIASFDSSFDKIKGFQRIH